MDAPTKINDVNNVKEVYYGSGSVYAITNTGDLYAWGCNDYGQLGIGSTGNINAPQKIEGITDVKEIYCGDCDSFVAKTGNGDLYAWGKNRNGQLGIGSTETWIYDPTKIEGTENIEEVYIGGSGNAWGVCVIARTKTGELYSWGTNKYGQLGIGSTEDTVRTATKVEGINNVVEVYNSVSNIRVKTKNGELYTWGRNSDGQLGLAIGETCVRTPQKMANVTSPVKLGYCYGEYYILTDNGDLYGWYLPSSSSNPAKKNEKINNVKEITYNQGENMLAITKDGKAYIWGAYEDSWLGIGEIGTKEAPYCLTEIENLPMYGKQIENIFQYDMDYLVSKEGKCYVKGYGMRPPD